MSGLAVCKMFSIKDKDRPKVTMGVGVVGVILAILGLADFLNTYISIIGAVVPPIMGIVISDYWVICKADKTAWLPRRGTNWVGIIAWVLGGGFALLETLGVLQVFSRRWTRGDRLCGLCCALQSSGKDAADRPGGYDHRGSYGFGKIRRRT